MERISQELRREQVQAGRREGAGIRADMATMSDSERREVEIGVAQRLIGSTGLEQNYNQGRFYEAVPNIPLSILRQIIEGRKAA